ncbi:unnamed protein product, partial [marine sediment metagenome]
SLSVGKDGVTVLGVINHGSKFMIDRRDVDKFVNLLTMENSPMVKG